MVIFFLWLFCFTADLNDSINRTYWRLSPTSTLFHIFGGRLSDIQVTSSTHLGGFHP